jgi:CheY-like chemotaxis protein
VFSVFRGLELRVGFRVLLKGVTSRGGKRVTQGGVFTPYVTPFHYLRLSALKSAMANILYAEDSADDALLLSHAFRKAGLPHVLIRVGDGEEAITYLCEKPRPDLVLLDLKMPKLDGFDVLAYIQTKPELKGLPVIVLSASELPADIAKAQRMGAKDYFPKTWEWDTLAKALKSRFETILAN